MFSAKRLLLPSLALTLLFLLLTIEARKYSDDEPNSGELRHHRHRHRHDAPVQQRWSSAGSRKRLNSNDDNGDGGDDYEADYTGEADYDEYAETEESDELDYSVERRNGRVYSPKRNGNNNHHRYEPRYPTAPRYHHRGSHRVAGTGRPRGHDRAGHHRARTAYRKRYEDETSEEDSLEARRRRYEDPDDSDEGLDNEPSGYYFNKHKGGGSSRKRLAAGHSPDVGVVEPKGRRSRYEPRKDWRYKVDDQDDDYAYDADDEDEEALEEEEAAATDRSRKYASARKGRLYEEPKSVGDRDKSTLSRRSNNKFDEWMRWTRFLFNNGSSRSAKRRNTDRDDELDRDEEADLWRDVGDELDNDFYKNDAIVPPLKTYDDIIRRLTEEDGTVFASTVKPTTQVKRNTDLESHLRRDAYGNLRFYDSRRNSSVGLGRYRAGVGPTRNTNLVDGTSRSEGRKDLAVAASVTRKKSLDEYEEDEDSAKGGSGGGEDEGTQADANTVSLSLSLCSFCGGWETVEVFLER